MGTGEGSEEDSSLRWGETQSCMPPLLAQLKNWPGDETWCPDVVLLWID